MISRLAIPVIVVVLLTALYFDFSFWRRKRRWWRLLHWLFPLAVIGITVDMADTPYYFPEKIWKFHYYVAMLAVLVFPLALVASCSLVGRLVKRPHTGELVGWCLALVVAQRCPSGHVCPRSAGNSRESHRQHQCAACRPRGVHW